MFGGYGVSLEGHGICFEGCGICFKGRCVFGGSVFIWRGIVRLEGRTVFAWRDMVYVWKGKVYYCRTECLEGYCVHLPCRIFLRGTSCFLTGGVFVCRSTEHFF